MKRVLLIILIIVINSIFCTHIDTPFIQWSKTYGGAQNDYSKAVCQTYDGGYIICGTTYSFNDGSGYGDVYVIKTDSLGDILWTRTYGGSIHDGGKSICQTKDSCYVITGVADSHGGFDGRVYLFKINLSGDPLWEKKYGNPNTVSRGRSVKQTTDGGYIVVGLTWLSFDSLFLVYLIKTDSLGNFRWSRKYGGIGTEDGFSVQQMVDGGYIIAGFTTSFGHGEQDVYFIRTDLLGDTLWTRAYGGMQNDCANEVQITTDGGYVIVGSTNSFSSRSQVYVIRCDSQGDTLWTRTYRSPGNSIGQSIKQCSVGGFIIAGMTRSLKKGDQDIYIIKTDSLGNICWTTTYEKLGNDIGQKVLETKDKGFIISETISDPDNGTQVHLMKIDLDAN